MFMTTGALTNKFTLTLQYRRLLGISYGRHKTNEYVYQQVDINAGCRELLLSIVKRRKLLWFGHACGYDTLTKIIQLTLPYMVVVAEEDLVNH